MTISEHCHCFAYATMVQMILLLWSIVSCSVVSSLISEESEILTLMGESKGFPVDSLGDIEPARSPEVLQCPSENLITTRQKCQVGADWVDCTRKHCCKDYTYIAGRCIHKETDPCSLNLCEQKCAVYLQRVICTCFHGYQYSSHNQRYGIKPVCIDIDECLENNGDCEQRCINVPGSFHCACDDGYTLDADNQTCNNNHNNMTVTGPFAAATKEKCFANCETVSRLHERIRMLHEHVAALNTAIRLSSFASGPPGPPGPPGPVGPAGPRGYSGIDSNKYNSNARDFSYSMMDSYSATANGLCKCQRGPIGPPGASGPEGLKGADGIKGSRGPRGQRGSFDFILLLLADLRHDIMNLESAVYPKGESPPKFNIQYAWKKQRMKEKIEDKTMGAMGAFSPPVIQKGGVSITTDGKSGQIKRANLKMQTKGDCDMDGSIYYIKELIKLININGEDDEVKDTSENSSDENDDDSDKIDYDNN